MNITKSEIIALLNITEPFLMIDHVSWVSDSRLAKGRMHISEDIWFYKCHFVDEGMMPGVLQTECMLQTIVTVMCFEFSTNAKNCLINKSSVNFFRKIQGPGIINVSAEVSEEIRGLMDAKATLNFNEQKVASGQFRFVRPSSFI